ncbi:MAG TPA: hypothetical protein PLU87_06520 [Sedimentisphaerales bacterium]|nr:hypothetical protein [Sedimentisphaerales bacterium]HRS10505.1 hypothetical protein [Sedimentisphaerales bacterium]HRV47271.1 hypothetical protein [Sedimentisphaerales bacterium]
MRQRASGDRAGSENAGRRTRPGQQPVLGREIKKAVRDFLDAAAGKNPTTLPCGADSLGLHGAADLVVYVGHNGLMDFIVAQPQREPDAGTRQAIILACKSKPYFGPRLAELQCRSVLLTTGFMAPEAYTLDAAVAGWLARESGLQITDRAACAYHKHQKCGLTAARRLFFADE